MRVAAAVALLLAVACDDSPGKKDLTLDMTFAPEGGMCTNVIGAGPCVDIDTCPLDCSVEIVLRAARSDGGQSVGVQCRRFTSQDQRRLRELPELLDEMVDKFDWPVDTDVDLELAVYSPTSSENCPVADFDRSPPETPQGNRPGYFARARRVRVEEEAVAHLPLVCAELHSRCDSLNVDISTRIWSMRASLSFPVDAQNLVVRLARLIVDGAGVNVDVLRTMAWNNLQEEDARWTATVNEEDLGGPCLATLVGRLNNNVLSCDSSIVGDEGNTLGLEIEEDRMALILANLGGVPAQGLFVGRVIEPNGNPLAGATVQPVDGEATVVYLDDQMRPTTSTVTLAGGWIAIRERPRFPYTDAGGTPGTTSCCGYLEIEAGSLRGCSRGPVGLVNNTLTAGVLELAAACPTR